MADREKVIKGLEMCIRHGENPSVRCGQKDECPYEQNGLPCWIDLSKDALAMLKEQPQIVRCSDCVHQNYCSIHDAKYLDDWFCADGERKGNE